jgi:methylenetetrahydrofolate dehydrogenase (NADP+)/methenyltetrahydrofolate cyclohydrolase
MVLIQVGHDPAADYYVQNIIKTGAKLGCQVDPLPLPPDCGQQRLLDEIRRASEDPSIHGIMLQKPLPQDIDDLAAGLAIAPGKDLDGLNPENLGRIVLEADAMVPCTPLGVYATLRHYRIPVQGSRVVIIGRSAIVGKPLANILLWKNVFANATVTVCHSRSRDLGSITRGADILVAAIGRAGFVTAGMIRDGSVLLDVGINEVSTPEGVQSYVGDIDYNGCFDKAMAITPVPGGIGTITTSLLFLNLLKACLAAEGRNKSIDDFLNLIFDDK